MRLPDVAGYLMDVGLDVLGTFVDKTSNVIMAQLGDAATNTVNSAAEWWQHTGFASRPAPPTQGKSGCQTLTHTKSGGNIIYASRDVRGAKIYGNLKDGETCIYAAVGQARTLYKANGAIVHYTTSDNTPTGQQVMLYVGPDKIQLGNQYGVLTIDQNGVTIAGANGQAAIKVGASSGRVDVLGQQVNVQGSLVSCAGSIATCIGANASPTPLVQSAIYGASGQTGAPSKNVFIGP